MAIDFAIDFHRNVLTRPDIENLTLGILFRGVRARAVAFLICVGVVRVGQDRRPGRVCRRLSEDRAGRQPQQGRYDDHRAIAHGVSPFK
jgi:hypothetical protein